VSAADWLRERFPDAPAPLLARMLESLPEQSDSVPDALAEGALTIYARLLEGDDGRADAIPLLAADALLTHAFQAQAEIDPAGVAALARRCGAAGALGTLAQRIA
jgi:hypothetical protein